MLNIKFEYGLLCGNNTYGVSVLVNHEEKSPNGTHIAAESIFSAGMLKRLSKEGRKHLFTSLEGAIAICVQDVLERKKLEER